MQKRRCWRPRRLSNKCFPANLWSRQESIMEPVTSALAFLFFGFIALVLLVIAAKTIRIVPQATVMLVERLGRFDRPAKEGLNILVPFIDRPRAVFWTNTRPGITSIDL